MLKLPTSSWELILLPIRVNSTVPLILNSLRICPTQLPKIDLGSQDMDKRVETYMELIQEQARLKEASEKLKKEASAACDTMASKTKTKTSSSQSGSSSRPADHLQHVDLSAEMIAISDYNSVSEQLSDITDRANALLTELLHSPRITVYDPIEMLMLKEFKRDHGWVGSAKLGNCPPEKQDWRHSLDMIGAIGVAQKYGIHVIDQDR